MELVYPCPHYFLFEPLSDSETRKIWKEYKEQNSKEAEFEEIEGSIMHSVTTFAPWFDNWITAVANKQGTRLKILMIWNAEFLTFACQQMIRRQLEQRSYRCRVWFHIEDPTTIQSAIQSRCIIKRIFTNINRPIYKVLNE